MQPDTTFSKNYLRNLFSLFLLVIGLPLLAKESETAEIMPLPLETFIEEALLSDQKFEDFLLSNMALNYQKSLQLPHEDLLLSVQEQFLVSLSGERDHLESSISLSKPLPHKGAELDAEYNVTSNNSGNDRSSLSFTFSQSIAENAFGRSYEMLDKIIGLEVDIARHQIVEAYEDYLSGIIISYIEWWAAKENVAIAKSSLSENQKLLESVQRRLKQHISLPIDVNKTKILVIRKQERLIDLEQNLRAKTNTIQRILRIQNGIPVSPAKPDLTSRMPEQFNYSYANFLANSRTFNALRLLQNKSTVQIDQNLDSLLPSAKLLLGLETNGEETYLKNSNHQIFAGVQIDWPFQDTVNEAKLEVSKIEQKQTTLRLENANALLQNELQNLFLQMQKELQLKVTAAEKVKLATSVLQDETENYSLGKIDINDYINAVNLLDEYRFESIDRERKYLSLLSEWLRLTDQWVQKNAL